MIRRAVASLLLLIAPPAVYAQSAPPVGSNAPVIEVLASLGEFNDFVAALEAAGLADQLKGAGPFTVYAVSNSGFARIPADTMAALKADPARFKRVLAHHVLPSKVTGADMMNLPLYSKVPTMAGDSMVVYHDKGGIKVDLSLVKTGDIEAGNGVIHTVHKLILVP